MTKEFPDVYIKISSTDQEMSLRVICLVLFVATVNAGPVSVTTAVTNIRSSLADKIDRVLSKTARGFNAVAAIVASLDRRLVAADKRLGRLEKGQSRIEGAVSLAIKNYTELDNVVKRLESLRARRDCPATWVKHSSLCFKFYKCQKLCSANDVKKFCEAQGATLASLKSAQLNTFVSSLVTDLRYYLAGARDDLVEGEWRWADGSRVVYTNWAEHQPNNIGGREHCLLVLKNQKNNWNDAPCSSKLNTGYVCEKKTR